MNEDHIVAAILTAGIIARGGDEEIRSQEAIALYDLTLAELIASRRPPREAESGTS